jgi:hypothetical protein
MCSQYSVQKCKLSKNNINNLDFYGNIHGSHDCYTTLCNQEINHRWYIHNTTFNGKITCKQCLKVMKKDEKI